MKKIGLIVMGALIFTGSFCLALFLLYHSKFSGAEFVAFVIAFAVIGLVVAFASEVKEFSIAGNIVKLKEIKSEAEKTIAELKVARTETFRFLLKLAKRYPGGFASSGPVDDRVEDFWTLYNNIVEFDCEKELNKDILEVVNTILLGQLYRVGHFSDHVGLKYRKEKKTPHPEELEEVALDSESIGMAAKRNVEGGDVEKIRSSMKESINEYRQLYELKERLEKYEKN